jgi:hypothetical protein
MNQTGKQATEEVNDPARAHLARKLDRAGACGRSDPIERTADDLRLDNAPSTITLLDLSLSPAQHEWIKSPGNFDQAGTR